MALNSYFLHMDPLAAQDATNACHTYTTITYPPTHPPIPDGQKWYKAPTDSPNVLKTKAPSIAPKNPRCTPTPRKHHNIENHQNVTTSFALGYVPRERAGNAELGYRAV